MSPDPPNTTEEETGAGDEDAVKETSDSESAGLILIKYPHQMLPLHYKRVEFSHLNLIHHF